MKIKKRKHFFLGKFGNTGCLYLRKTFSNIMVTLTDLRRKVIVCKTSGNPV